MVKKGGDVSDMNDWFHGFNGVVSTTRILLTENERQAEPHDADADGFFDDDIDNDGLFDSFDHIKQSETMMDRFNEIANQPLPEGAEGNGRFDQLTDVFNQIKDDSDLGKGVEKQFQQEREFFRELGLTAQDIKAMSPEEREELKESMFDRLPELLERPEIEFEDDLDFEPEGDRDNTGNVDLSTLPGF